MKFLKENTPLITNIATLASFVGLILLFHVESRTDFRHMESKTYSLHKEIKEEISAIHAEIKDFHGRLCAIEERRSK